MTTLFSAALYAVLVVPSIGAAWENDEKATHDARALILQVIEKQELNQELQRQYTYLETTTTEYLDKNGGASKTKSETFRVIPSAEGEYRRLVSRNGRPLSAKEEKKEEEKFRKYQKRELSAEERRKGKRNLAKQVERFQKRLREALDIYNFAPRPDEEMEGQPIRRFDFQPRPEYEPHSRSTNVLKRLEGSVWIDPARSQLTRLHLYLREDLSFLKGIFGKISKGSEANAQAQRIGDGLWILDEISATLRARFYFLKRYNRRVTYTYTDYQSFGVESEVTGFRPATPE